MKYSLYLLLFIIFFQGMDPAFAKDTRYRVELIVLTHLQHNSEPMEFLQLEDYSSAIDFLTPPPEDDEEPGSEGAAIDDATAETGITEVIDPLEAPIDSPVDPNRVEHIEEMSDVMRESWRRLRLSGPFRPEQYLSWEQGEQEPFPSLRLHDLEVVLVDDPYADLRQELEETEVFTDQAVTIDGAEEPGIPDPTLYHRLDGTVVLRRTRFLHLDLNLQLREAVWEETSLLTPLPISEPEEQETPRPTAFLVHSLEQSRQVRSRRMEYFDGPVLSVLAFITPIKISESESP
jgi:hypothetical protein